MGEKEHNINDKDVCRSKHTVFIKQIEICMKTRLYLTSTPKSAWLITEPQDEHRTSDERKHNDLRTVLIMVMFIPPTIIFRNSVALSMFVNWK